MRNIVKTLCITTILSTSTVIHSTEISESVVTLQSTGQPLIGTLVLPGNEPAPVALLLHGFTGARDELSTDHVKPGVFAHAAEVLAQNGIASLRIDFRGSGESLDNLTFADTTFEGQIEDATAAINFLSGLDSVNGEAIHVIGWSQGGLVAASAAGRGVPIDSLSLWNAVGNPKSTYAGIFGAEFLDKAIAAEPEDIINATLPWGAEIELKGAFFDGVADHDPIAEIKEYNGPLFVAVGNQDTTVNPATGQQYIDSHEGPEKLWATDMDHVFNIFGTADTLNELIEQTVDFINTQ